MSKDKVRIRLKAYDHRILDNAAKKIVETVKRSGGEISGPVPLPTEIEKFTILRAVHKYKDSREQFEMRTHKRLIDVKNLIKQFIVTIYKVIVLHNLQLLYNRVYINGDLV